VSNAGGLGIIGSGSMYPDVLKEHVKKFKAATDKPFAVNIPLLYPAIDEHIETIIEEKVPIVFSSAGSPKKWTPILKENGIKVVHVCASSVLARKVEAAGCDAVVAEGFEAGGHNGREETTTMCLIPQVVNAVDIPVIAAGGIGTGKSMAAAFALGAEAVQIGSRFVASPESSGHEYFKQAVINAKEGDTKLSMKKLVPVRLLKNKFFEEVKALEDRGAAVGELQELLGRARSKKGMFEGDLDEGELEIGQISGYIDAMKPAGEIVEEIVKEFNETCEQLGAYRL
jgi:enoyl-[acyl-carrier protein] reductase II